MAGAALAAAAVAGCGSPSPKSKSAGRWRPARRSYLRGVNSYTLYYASGGGQLAGEPRSSYAFLAARGHRIVRLPFEWGFIQPRLGGALDARFLAALEREVERIGDAGMRVILDLHSGGRHPAARGAVNRFGVGISQAQFADVWLRLSDRFGDDPHIYAYDLMNEPFDMPDLIWESFSQSAVNALRRHGDRTLLWIEGNQYSVAGQWTQHHPKPWIHDPLDYHAYSAHSYPGNVGKAPVPAPTAADERGFLADLHSFAGWLRRFRRRGSIGEVGWPSERRVGTAGASAWNRLGEAWFRIADAAGLDVTYFGASSAYANWLWAYDATRNALPAPGLDRAESQAQVIEVHPSGCWRAADGARCKPKAQ